MHTAGLAGAARVAILADVGRTYLPANYWMGLFFCFMQEMNPFPTRHMEENLEENQNGSGEGQQEMQDAPEQKPEGNEEAAE